MISCMIKYVRFLRVYTRKYTTELDNFTQQFLASINSMLEQCCWTTVDLLLKYGATSFLYLFTRQLCSCFCNTVSHVRFKRIFIQLLSTLLTNMRNFDTTLRAFHSWLKCLKDNGNIFVVYLKWKNPLSWLKRHFTDLLCLSWFSWCATSNLPTWFRTASLDIPGSGVPTQPGLC